MRRRPSWRYCCRPPPGSWRGSWRPTRRRAARTRDSRRDRNSCRTDPKDNTKGASGSDHMADLTKLVDDLSALTVIEAADLAKMLEEKWGVSAAAPVALAAAGGGAAPAAEAAAEKTEVDVILAAIGEKKVNLLQAV